MPPASWWERHALAAALVLATIAVRLQASGIEWASFGPRQALAHYLLGYAAAYWVAQMIRRLAGASRGRGTAG